MAANSVEGRFPFLDHRIVEYCSTLPPHLKIRGLREKYLLKKSAQGLLPPEICARPKQPYRAPIHRAFLDQPLDYVDALLSPGSIKDSGYFAPEAISRLLQKCRSGSRVSEGEDMALVGVLSTQLLHKMFIQDAATRTVPEATNVRICRGTT